MIEMHIADADTSHSRSSSTAAYLRGLGGLFGVLFFMAGGDAQVSVQATFLVLMASVLIGSEVFDRL